MTDYNTMNAKQCADWLAEREGWTFKYNSWWHPTIMASFHPYPLTLDAAAAALREPWRFRYMINYGTLWSVEINAYSPLRKRTIEDAPDELTARYRAAVAARMEDER